MKAGWESRRIDSFAKTGAGGTPTKSNPLFYEGGKVPWLLSGEVANANITEASNFITERGLANSAAKLFPPNSVLVAMYGATAGQAGILRFEAATNQAVCAVMPGREHQPEFLYYYLLYAKPTLVAKAVGNAQPNISQAKIKSLEVPLPPLEEQQRIVAILDEAFDGLDRARANAEANLQNARELFECILDTSFSRFSGEVKERKLANLISISHGFAFKSEDFGTSDDPSLPIVLTPGNYTEDACLKFTKKNTKRFTGVVAPNFLFEPGELTVVMTDLSSKMKILGKPAFIERKDILHNQRIGRIRFKSNDLHPRFLFHFLRTQAAQRPIRHTATGTMVRHTAPKRILNITIRTPVAFSDQERIVAQIDEVEAETTRMRTQYTEALQDLADLRQSLLQKAFAGALT